MRFTILYLWLLSWLLAFEPMHPYDRQTYSNQTFTDQVASSSSFLQTKFFTSKMSNMTMKLIKGEKSEYHGVDLSDTTFDDANLKNAIYDQCNLFSASFVGANLENARFTSVNLDKANFSGANLKNAIFEHTETSGAIFDGANLAGAKINDIQCESGSVGECKATPSAGTIKGYVTNGSHYLGGSVIYLVDSNGTYQEVSVDSKGYFETPKCDGLAIPLYLVALTPAGENYLAITDGTQPFVVLSPASQAFASRVLDQFIEPNQLLLHLPTLDSVAIAKQIKEQVKTNAGVYPKTLKADPKIKVDASQSLVYQSRLIFISPPPKETKHLFFVEPTIANGYKLVNP